MNTHPSPQLTKSCKEPRPVSIKPVSSARMVFRSLSGGLHCRPKPGTEKPVMRRASSETLIFVLGVLLTWTFPLLSRMIKDIIKRE